MVKMVTMKRTAADKGAEGDALGMPGRGTDRDGVRVNLDHDHIQSMKMDAPLPHGTKVEFGGKGEVVESGTHEGPDGPRHHMTILLKRAGVDHAEDGPEERREGLRGDIESAAKQKMQGNASADRKVPEKTGG